MARQFYTAIDLVKNELQNARIQNLGSAPASPVAGQIYYDTTDATYYGWTGSAWLNLGGGDGGDAATLEGEAGSYYLARANHTGQQTAATISDFDTQVRTSRLDQMAAPTSNLSINAQRVVNVADPQNPQDAATKSYVDLLVSSGIEHVDSVLSRAVDSPPGSPTTGDRYIVGTGSGAWSGHDDEIAEWDGAAWDFTTLSEGLSCWVDDEDARYTWSGAAWVKTETLSDLTAGAGLTKSGNTVAVGAGAGITVNADDVAIDTAVVARRYAANVGDGAATQYTLTHNLGTRDVVVQVFANAGQYPTVEVDVERTGTNTVRLTFAAAPASDAYRAIITG